MAKENIDNKTDEVVKNAKNVIEKTLLSNIQQTASLLGETAAEMEIIISSLIKEVERLKAKVDELENKNE